MVAHKEKGGTTRAPVMRYEFWYDSHHTGALRVVDHQQRCIHGSDPGERYWTVSFAYVDAQKSGLRVDFASKRTHRGKRIMEPRYTQRRSVLHWPDGNEWRRIRVDPRLVLSMMRN